MYIHGLIVFKFAAVVLFKISYIGRCLTLSTSPSTCVENERGSEDRRREREKKTNYNFAKIHEYIHLYS